MLLAASLALALAGGSGASPPDDARMNWWREAKFGLFIHWGLYAVPAGEWNGVKTYGEWIRESAHIPVKTYEQFLGQFNPVKFDPDAWVKMIKDAGMKYLVITSKHHDGFNLFDSPYSEWDVMSTPYKKDILKMLSEACKRQGIRFCTYHSIMDWHHPDYLPKRGWEGETWRESTVDPVGADFKPDFSRFVKYLHNEVEYVAKTYDPGIMWFDGQWEGTWNTDLGQDLLALCRRVRPGMIVNNRVNSGPQGGGDYLTPEQEIPQEAIAGKDWETCMTMNRNWGYNRVDLNYKSTKQLIQMLCDIASKGGNFLLNIGPTAEGEFPPMSVERLKEIGEWMRVNGESIYGTQASPFGKLPWGRCTQKRDGKDTLLYLQVFDWPEDGKLRVPGLGNDVQAAYLIRGRGILGDKRDGGDVIIDVPNSPIDGNCSVIVVKVKGEPIVYRTPEIVAEAQQFVTKISVELRGSPGLDLVYTTDGSEPAPSNPSNRTYRSKFALTATTTLKSRAFHQGKPVSGVAETRFEKATPFPAKEFPNLKPGLEVRLFEGNWDKCPEFYFITSGYTTKTLPTVSIADDPAKEYCGRYFRGVIEVPETEMYRFALSSDDGSRLWIGGRLVVDNDGLHGTVEKTGAIALAKGKHEIAVAWFNKTGGAQLSLKWAKLGGALKDVLGQHLWHQAVR